MTKTVVSIIIPCYEQQSLLKRALDSLNDQDVDLDVIVIDDGSSEAVYIPTSNYKFSIRLIRQQNGGLSAARNTGLKYAVGEYVKFLDADDALLPYSLKKQVDSISLSENVISIIGAIEVDEDTGLKKKIIPTFGDALPSLFMDNLAPVHSYLFKKKTLDLFGGFISGARTEGGCEDYDLIFRLAIKGCSFLTLHDLGVIYFRRHGTMSRNNTRMKIARTNVWLDNVSEWLDSSTLHSSEHIIPLLTGLTKLCGIVPKEQTYKLKRLVYRIHDYILDNNYKLSPVECKLLLSLMKGHTVLDEISRIIRSFANETNCMTLSIVPQSLNDYRVHLSSGSSSLDYDWICSILENANKYDGYIGIYGAGDIGFKIEQLCRYAGFGIKCFFDKNPSTARKDLNSPVRHIDEIPASDIRLLVIASISFYDEIKLNLNSCGYVGLHII